MKQHQPRAEEVAVGAAIQKIAIGIELRVLSDCCRLVCAWHSPESQTRFAPDAGL
jgi:hypothetical protein